MRVGEMLPKPLIAEFLRLYRKNPEWVQWKDLGNDHYRAQCMEETWLRKLWVSGADAFNMWACSVWLGQGPKLFKPSQEVQAALANVEVRLHLNDYRQPFPALMVAVDFPPFNAVLCHHSEHLLSACLFTADHEGDITTTIARKQADTVIEHSIVRFDEECRRDAKVASQALRVAINSCLALTHYGCHLNYLFPREVESDRWLAREQTERGERARQRLATAVQVASFAQEVRLYQTTAKERGNGDGTERATHWRRGHWAMQPHGPQNSLRKLIFRAPVLVRADLFTGDLAQTSATYR